MPVRNNDVADIFDKTADLLELQGANPYRVRAYRSAAQTVRSLSGDVSDMVKKGEDLSQLSGIGKDLAGKIKNIVKTGKLDLLEELETGFPEELSKVMNISGLGAKRVKVIYDELNIKSIDDLKKAAEEHKIRHIEGFGEKTEQSILEGIKKARKADNRMKISIADQYARPLIEYLKKDKKVKNIEITGSYRRRKETVGDLDILVTCDEGSEVAERFVNYEDVREVVSKGKTRSTVILRGGIHVDLRVVPEKSYGAAMLYFTGSKAHNIAVRNMAVKRGWKINEYGVYEKEKQIAGKTEEEIYDLLGLDYIEPELRENRGEIEVAQKGKLPKLIELKDIKGDLHSHTTATDGRNSLEEMVEAAQKRGYEYLANTEHSKHVTVARGLDEKRMWEQIKRIDKINEKLKDFVVLKSIELDILEDGSLDLPDKVLKELDLIVCAVHYKFKLSRQKQTERIIKGLDSPYCNILAHPTGRMINQREPYDVNMEQVMQAAKERGCFLEINSHPERLDLNDIYAKRAKELGIKIAISTDAHSTNDLALINYGIGQARRGWLTADDVINARKLPDLRKLLKRK